VKVAKNTTGTSFAGFDELPVTATNNRVMMQYFPKWYQITVALPMDELAVADTPESVLDLIKLTLQSDTEDMADDLGNLFYADGTGNDGKDLLGLAALVDDGTTVANIGELPRAAYPTLKSTVTASGGTLTLAKVDTLWDNVSEGTNQP